MCTIFSNKTTRSHISKWFLMKFLQNSISIPIVINLPTFFKQKNIKTPGYPLDIPAQPHFLQFLFSAAEKVGSIPPKMLLFVWDNN